MPPTAAKILNKTNVLSLGAASLVLGFIAIILLLPRGDPRPATASRELAQIVKHVRAIYATSAMVDLGADMVFTALPVAQSGGGLTYIQAGVFPADAVQNGNIVINPWGGAVIVHSVSLPNAADRFVVEFTGLPPAACATFVTDHAGAQPDAGLAIVSVSKHNIDLTALPKKLTIPVTMEAARAACGDPAAAPTDAVAFAFQLNSGETGR